MLISDGVMSWVPHTHAYKKLYLECRCGFHMGVGAGGPNFTHGLPVTSTRQTGKNSKNEWLLALANGPALRPAHTSIHLVHV